MPRSKGAQQARAAAQATGADSGPATTRGRPVWLLLELAVVYGVPLPKPYRSVVAEAFADLRTGRIGSLDERLGRYWGQRDKRSSAHVRADRPARVNQMVGQVLAESPGLPLTEALRTCGERMHLSFSVVRRAYYDSLKRGGTNYAKLRGILVGAGSDAALDLERRYPPCLISDVALTNENDAL